MSENTTPKITPESGLPSHALFSSLFHPDDSDRGFLMWIHERLEHIHRDSDLANHMRRLRAIIADMPADRLTKSTGQGKNSLRALRQSIMENVAAMAAAEKTPPKETTEHGEWIPRPDLASAAVPCSAWKQVYRVRSDHNSCLLAIDGATLGSDLTDVIPKLRTAARNLGWTEKWSSVEHLGTVWIEPNAEVRHGTKDADLD